MANSHDPSVMIAICLPARHRMATNLLLERECSVLAAVPHRPVRKACLGAFRCVDPVQPDTRAVDLDRIAVDHLARSGEIGGPGRMVPDCTNGGDRGGYSSAHGNASAIAWAISSAARNCRSAGWSLRCFRAMSVICLAVTDAGKQARRSSFSVTKRSAIATAKPWQRPSSRAFADSQILSIMLPS